jgi:lysophospholipase L1-like esterase
MTRRLLYSFAVAIAIVPAASSFPTNAQTVPAAPACTAPADLTRLGQALAHTARRLSAGEPVTIVAVGSSSTAGAGASTPAKAYPAQLEAELKGRFPGIPIRVLNRGVNGEEASQMVARFESTVLSERPDLVLWQVGTNAVLRDHTTGEAPLIKDGIQRLKAAGADIVLIDPQYAPKVITKPDAERMVALIGAEAKAGNIGLFQRFAIMRHWHEVEGASFETLFSPDGLHMNDWSYGCVARLLGIAIGNAARAPAVAGVPTLRP